MPFTLKHVDDSLIQPEFDPPLWERLNDPDAPLSADDFDYLLDLYRGDMARAKELENSAKLATDMADNIKLKAQAMWNKFEDRLRNFTLNALQEQGRKRREFVFRKHILKARKVQPKLELDDAWFVNEYRNTEWVRERVTHTPDRDAVKAAMKQGAQFIGASLVTQPDSVILEMGGVECLSQSESV